MNGQGSLFDLPAEHPDFDGRTFSREDDKARLANALGRVYAAFIAADGEWLTLPELAEAAACSEAGASARLRDLRKPKFKRYYPNEGIESKRLAGGLWGYRMRRSHE